MSNKIKELTEKIYNEGVAKAKVEAASIIAKANEEAALIREMARQEKSNILQDAKEQLIEYEKNMKAEVQLASRQAINSLKQQVKTLVVTAQVEFPVKEAFKNSDFIKNIILTLIRNWNPQKPEELNLNVLLPKKDELEMMEFFKTNAIGILNQGMEFHFDTKISNGFKIGPKDGSYVISFTDKDFEEYFKSYLKDKTAKLLFEEVRTNGEVKRNNYKLQAAD